MKRLIKWLLFTITLCFFGAAFVACGETQGKKPKKESFDLYMIEYTDYQTYKEYKDVNDRRWENYVQTRSYSFYKNAPNLQADGEHYFFRINDGLGAIDDDMTTEGFTFMGVYSEPDGKGDMYVDKKGLIVKEITTESARLDLYLYTVPIEYKARLHGADGGDNTFVEYNYRTDEKELPILEKENYEFVGWCQHGNSYCDGSCAIKKITYGTWGIEEFFPVFKGVENMVTLDALDGYLYDNNNWTISYNDTYWLPVPYAPTRMGFAGWWYDDGNGGYFLTDKTGQCLAPFSALKDITATAVYKPQSVVWVNTSVKNKDNQEIIEGVLIDEEIELVAPSITGYRCVGLGTADGQPLMEGNRCKYTIETENVKLVWNYEPLETMVLLQADGAYVNGELPQAFAYEQSYTLPKAYKKGYAFQGWVMDGEYGEVRLTGQDGKFTEIWTSIEQSVSVRPSFIADSKAVAPVYDIDSLQSIKDDTSGSYILLQDVDMAGEPWQPFAFSGNFDGNERKILGLTANATTGDLGLFTTLTGTVKNLTLENVSIESTSGAKVNVGGLCGSLNGTVQNVTVSGSVKADYANIGGIVGIISGGSITGLKNYAIVSTVTLESGASAGGVVGAATAGTISACENYGNVSGFACVGGVLGRSNNMFVLKESKNQGDVTGTSECIGGVLGKIETNGVGAGFQVFSLQNSGEVNGKNYTGGVIGYWKSFLDWSTDDTYYVDVYKLTNSGAVTGANTVGGCVGNLSVSASNGWGRHPKMQVKATDFVNTGDVTGETVVGGCIGYGSGQVDSKIIRSSSSATIRAEHTVGGVAGSLSGMKVDSCQNTDSMVTATSYYESDGSFYVRLGGIVGLAYEVVNCQNQANIEYQKSAGYIGGIAGYVSNTVSNCQNGGKINAPFALFVGGIAGYVNNSYVYNMSELKNSGDIVGNECVGGIFGGLNVRFGINDSNTHTATFSKLNNSGVITASGGFSGGVIGKITAEGVAQYGHNASVKIVLMHVENSGDVTTGSNFSVGGIVGYAETDSVSSGLNDYTCTGLLNGAKVTVDIVVGNKLKFNVVS